MNGNRTITRVGAVAAGAVAALIVWALALTTGGIQVALGGGEATDMPWWQVLAASVVAGLAGWALLAILEARLGARARRTWTIVAIVVALVSLAGPLGMPGIETGDRFWLAGVHLLLAATYIPTMAATARPSAPSHNA